MRLRRVQTEIFNLDREMSRCAASPLSNVVGSPEWAMGMLVLVRSVWKSKLTTEDSWNEVTAKLDAYEAWNLVPKHAPFGSREAMYAAIGITQDDLAERQETWAKQTTAAQPGNPNATTANPSGKAKVGPKGANGMFGSEQPSNTQKRLARLKRDAPQVGEAWARGEYPSVNAAWRHAIETGAVQVRSRRSPVERVVDYVAKVAQDLDAQQRAELLGAMRDLLER
jgi:hypothetical protein